MVNQYRYVHLNTRQRDAGSIEEPVFFLRRKISLMNLKENGHTVKFRLRLIQASIPFSWYTINDHNNKVYYAFTNTSTPDGHISIPVGNYNVFTLARTLEALLDNVSFTDLTISYNRTTNKFIFDAGATPLSIIFQSDSPFRHFGFDLGSVWLDTVYTPPGVANISPLNAVYIRMKNILQLNTEESGNQSGYSDILAKVNLNADQFGIIDYEPCIPYEIIANTQTINEIQLQLTSENSDDVLHLNHEDWQCSIEISLIDEEEN